MQKTIPLGCWIEEVLRTLLAIRQKSREPSYWEVMESFILLTYATLAASRTLLQRLLSCLNFTLDSEDLSFWYKQKKWFLWTMAAAQAAENHGDEWCLTWYLTMRDIYINSNLNSLSKFTSSRSTEFKDILPWNISQMITKTIPISTRIVIRHAMKQGIRCEYNGKSMETETITWSKFPNRGTAIVEQILVSEEINPKEQDCENHSLGS